MHLQLPVERQQKVNLLLIPVYVDDKRLTLRTKVTAIGFNNDQLLHIVVISATVNCNTNTM
jgi:hypothetical protein